MIDYEGMVREFHRKYGHYEGKLGYTYPLEVVQLREKLIAEEAEEFKTACYRYKRTHNYTVDIIEMADALADILYVVFGAAIAFGIPIEKVFTEVHRSNMTKSKEKDAQGKTHKGDSYEPPNVRRIIMESFLLGR